MPMTAPVLQAPGKGETIEMTAPVLQRSGTEAETFRVAFVLPQRYDLAGAPPPTDPRVHLREVPARLVAAHRYTGFWSEARYREHEAILLTALQAAGYEAVGAPEWARYNPPFMPWFLRRNEIMVEVRQTDGTRR